MSKLSEILTQLYKDGCVYGGNESDRDPDGCIPEAEAAIKSYILEIIGEDDRDYSPDHTDEESKKFLIWTSTACNQLRAEQKERL